MIAVRQTQKFLLALACCLALVIVVPLSVSAQDNILEKGAHGVKKGVETGAEKTKEGAHAVGKGVKNTFGNKDSQMTTESQSTTESRQKPSEPATSESNTQPGTRSGESTTQSQTTQSKSQSSTRTEGTGKSGEQLPATAGELPLLLLAGGLALAASGTLRLARRTN
jgi:uncharacterized surface anchored protein